MREPSKSIWYQLGYALESARHGVQSAQRVGSTNKAHPAEGRSARVHSIRNAGGESTDAERRPTSSPARSPTSSPARSPASSPVSSTLDQLIATGTGMLGDRLLSVLVGRRPGTLRLTRAALAGAGAALALTLFRNGKNGTAGAESPYDPTAEILAGAARGMLYGAVLEPRLPGSPLLRGATYGVMEYVTSPFGGLDGILGASSPHRTMPIIAALLGPADSGAGSIAHHVVFGVTLGLLYGEGRARRGSLEAE